MKLGKTLAILGSFAATGAAAAATYVFSRTERGKGLADRARTALDALGRHLRGEPAAPTAEPTEDPTTVAESVRVEHAIEHGAEGRARAVEQSRKPHVAPVQTHAAFHPARARRHA